MQQQEMQAQTYCEQSGTKTSSYDKPQQKAQHNMSPALLCRNWDIGEPPRLELV